LVITGAPHPSLKGDLLFMAQKMHVQCPPLPFGSHAEYRLFNKFMEKHPKASPKDVSSFCRDMLTKVDFKTIFPKTAPLFKARYLRWKEASLIRCLNQTIKSAFVPLIQKLAQPVSASSTRGSVTMVPMVMPLHDQDRKAAGAQTTENSMEGLHAPTLGMAKPGMVQMEFRLPDKEVVKKCFYWPFCISCATICGGHHKDTCHSIRNGTVILPSDFTEKKVIARAKAKAEDSKRRRAATKNMQKAKRNKQN
jgi:hypothetical protein